MTTNDFFEQELSAKSNELLLQGLQVMRHGATITLADIVNKIQPHVEEITALMIGKIQKSKLQSLAARIIVDGCEGRVRVPHFSQSADKTSPIWVYVGTHWVELAHEQLFFDFIRDALVKMELSEEFVDDEPFFKKLKKRLELMLSRHTQSSERDDMVLVNFVNGTLEIARDGAQRFRPHHRDDYLRYVLPYAYDPQADCPRFLRFLDEVLPSPGTHTTILEYLAYCLVPWLKLEKILAFQGTGSNGKSVLLSTIERLFGKENVAYENLVDLTTNESHRANIEGRLVNISTENEGRINGAAFKTLASGEPISCRLYYSQPYTMTRYARLMFAFNEMPRINSGYGSMRRWLLVKFDVRISEEQADTELGEKLAQELSGIMNLVLGILPGLMKRKKFTKCEETDEALADLEFQNNSVLQFVSARCEPSSTLTRGSDLYKAFCEYCHQNNLYQLSNQKFYQQLEEKFPSKMDGNQKAFYIKVVRYED